MGFDLRSCSSHCLVATGSVFRTHQTMQNEQTFVSVDFQDHCTLHPKQSRAQFAFCNCMSFWTFSSNKKIDGLERSIASEMLPALHHQNPSNSSRDTTFEKSTWGQDVAFNAKSCLVNFETNLRVVVKFMTNAQLWQFGTPPAGWNFSDWWLSNSEDGVPRLCNVERRCWFSLPSFLGSIWFERVWQQPSAN